MDNIFQKGINLTIAWRLVKPDGTDFNLDGYTHRLFYGVGNRYTAVSSSTVSGNVVSWTFTAENQTAAGDYSLRLMIYQNGKIFTTVAYDKAFSLYIGTSANSQQIAGTNAGNVVSLLTMAEFYALAPVVPTVSNNGYWFVNGETVLDGRGNPVLSSHTLTYDEETGELVIDQGRKDGRGASIEQRITALADAIEDSTNAATLANEKAGLANNAATLANEKAELANNAATLANEKAELANNATTLANEKAGLANEKASDAETAAKRANEAAAAAEHQVDVKRGYGIQSVTQPVVATTNGGVNTIRVTTEDGKTFDLQVRNGKSSAGFFQTSTALNTTIPSPNAGDYAFVSKAGDGTFPAYIYVCTTAGTWSATEKEFTPDDPTDIEDTLESDSITAALSAKQGKVLNSKVSQFGQDVKGKIQKIGYPMENGKYWALTGTSIPSSKTSATGWLASDKIPVRQGQKFLLSTVGGATGRAYAFSNTAGVIVAVAPENTTYTEMSLTAPTDGFLVVNYHITTDFSFLLRIEDSSMSTILGLIRNLEDEDGDLATAINSIESQITDTEEYVLSDLDSGKYYKLIDTKAASSQTALAGWYSKRFPVRAGQRAVLSTKGGGNGRAYAITDSNRTIISRADADATLVDYELQIAQDGYIYVNYNSSSFDFSLKIITDNILEIAERVSVLENRREYTLPAYHNNPYPIHTETLKVLVLGNSFTGDSTDYLDSLVDATAIDQSKLCVYSSGFSGATIDQWIAEITNNETRTISRKAGTMSMTTTEGPMHTLLAQDWDVIVITQASDKSYTWSNYANLLKYVSLLRLYCPNQKVCIAFQMPWGHTEASTPSELAGNIDCIMSLAGKYGIDYIIPAGMAIQNARGTSLNNDSYLTRDNWHLCYGVGKYVAACSFYQSIIAPVFNINIIGNSAVHALTPSEEDDTSIAVTSENNTLCQMCAFAASIDMFEITQVES